MCGGRYRAGATRGAGAWLGLACGRGRAGRRGVVRKAARAWLGLVCGAESDGVQVQGGAWNVVRQAVQMWSGKVRRQLGGRMRRGVWCGLRLHEKCLGS